MGPNTPLSCFTIFDTPPPASEISGATLPTGQQGAVNVTTGTLSGLGSVVKGSKVLIATGKTDKLCEISRVTPTQLILNSNVTVTPAQSVKVYLCTPEFEAVDKLCDLRNVCFAHRNKEHLT